jgi:hypothetical protein
MMIAMHNELVIPLSDLESILIECASCGSEVRVKMDAEFKPPTAKVPPPLENCPVCSTRFDSTLRPNIQEFKLALANLKDHSKISLTITPPVDLTRAIH